MLTIPVPLNEPQRQEALKKLNLIDTDFEPAYDTIARLAADICGTPIALISIVDADRLWFKAVVGLDDVREVSRGKSFCCEAVYTSQFLEVMDATQDPRFADNPLVTEAPHVRFYAGAPLIDSDNFGLGVLCVLDRVPRSLNDSQKQQLSWLADLVMQLLQDRVARINLMQQAIEREYDAIRHYRETPAMTYSTDAQGLVLKVSDYWCKVLGYTREEVIGRRSIEFLSKASRRYALDVILPNFLLTGHCRDVPYQIVKKNGELIDVLLSASSDRDDNGKVLRSWAVLVDVTERNRLALALEAEKEKAQVTLHSIGDAVITTDNHGRVEYLNPIAERMTGWLLSEAQGRPLNKIFNIINEYTREPAYNPVLRCINEGIVLGLEDHTVLIRRDGQELSIEDSAAPIRSTSGEIVGAVLVFHDVTIQRQLQDKITFQAHHDELTGLINRSRFNTLLKQLFTEVSEQDDEHALCYLDLDQFKLVNDTCGHAAGDELLRQLSVLLKSKVRKHDTLARLGGDEFGLLLKNCTLDDAQRLAQVFLTVVEEFRFYWQEKLFKIGVSIGLVPVTKASIGPESVLQIADTACYAAKEGGRNRIYVLTEQDDELSRRHDEMQWYNRIPQALEADRFILYAQTIQSIKPEPNTKLRFEILIRIKGESGEIIPPGAFMPAAERYSLACSIDSWVLETTLGWLASTPGVLDNLDLCAINLSGQSLGDPLFCSFVIKQLERFHVAAEKICFELTESAVVTNLANAFEFMKKLGAHGCRFALDDFGSGLSSLGYLKTLPVDILKIDGLFVRNIMDDPVELALVRSINEIAQLLGKKTIAEYVENEGVLDQLRLLGVDYVQGYGVGVPVPLHLLQIN